MAELTTLSQEMNTKKVIVDMATDGIIYIGLTHYPRPYVSTDNGYRECAQTGEPIWKIKKIVDNNGITEMFYPNGNYGEGFVWDCRTCYNYV